MFNKCKYCNSVFKGVGYFCSDACEIKNHASEIMMFKNTPIHETKEELTQVKEELPEIPILDTKIVEKREETTQVEVDLKIKNKVLETPLS